MQPFGQPQLVQNRGYGGYNAYSHLSYPSQQYPASAHYPQAGYYPSYSQGGYNPVPFQGFQGSVQGHVARGRASFVSGRGGGAVGYGRGAYFTGSVGDRGRGCFGIRARRKKPFVGGSLETQRQWERQTVCCFFLQKNCKFVDACRFLHEDDGIKPCQFGAQCRVGHSGRARQPGGTAEAGCHSPSSGDDQGRVNGHHDGAAESS
uniref:C3H1-type domain-containing protein n=1 Tax=Trypanosoma congolense (strain IL3000) TaxID=1068625 RepID=G0UY09_TRYCI|nr:conserved hypothetical protein [Trypanosoma congolense IL3000]